MPIRELAAFRRPAWRAFNGLPLNVGLRRSEVAPSFTVEHNLLEFKTASKDERPPRQGTEP